MRIKITLLVVWSLLLPTASLAVEDEPSTSQALYYELAPSLVTNVQGRVKYVRCDIQLMTRTEMALQDLKLHAPAIRHELLLLFSDQQGKELKDPQGKEKLRKNALAAVQGVMQRLTGKKEVEDLFFTSFFVQ